MGMNRDPNSPMQVMFTDFSAQMKVCLCILGFLGNGEFDVFCGGVGGLEV